MYDKNKGLRIDRMEIDCLITMDVMFLLIGE